MYAVAMSEATKGPMTQAEPNIDAGALLARIASERDKAALASLFTLFAPRLKSMMLKLGADSALAEDLVQETLLTVWRKAGLYSPERGAPSTWIFTIARNLRIDQLRRQSNKPYEDLDSIELTSDTPLGSFIVEQNEVIARVNIALEKLSQDQREVVTLSFIHNLPHAEIAARTGLPLGTVKSRLRLAYDRLRPMLEDLQ